MRPIHLALILPLLALAGCDAHDSNGDRVTIDTGNASDKDGDAAKLSVRAGSGDDKVAIDMSNGHAAIDVPGFSGKLQIPGLDLKAEHLDIDGMKLAPDTKVGTVDVRGEGQGGTVRIGFTNPQAPDALLAYYASAAKDGGYTAGAPVKTADGGSLDATKPGGKRFRIEARRDGSGSAGALLVSGSD